LLRGDRAPHRRVLEKTRCAAIAATAPPSTPAAGNQAAVPCPPRRTPSRGSSPTKRQDWPQRRYGAAWQQSDNCSGP